MNRETDLGALLNPKALSLPAEPRVVDIRVEPFVDHVGDSELRVWVVLDDSTAPGQPMVEAGWAITSAIRRALRAAGERRFTYTRFLTRSQFEREPEARWVRQHPCPGPRETRLEPRGDRMEIYPGISMNPAVRFGKPCISGTRLDVATVVGALAAGESFEAVQQDYDITREQILSALSYAAYVAAHLPPAVEKVS